MLRVQRGLEVEGNVSLSGNEADFVRVLSAENDGELFRGYPSSGPIDIWLYCCEPRIP